MKDKSSNIKKLEDNLNRSLKKSSKNIILILLRTEQRFLQMKALEELLERDNLYFEDLYQIPDELVINNQTFEKRIWEKFQEAVLTPSRLICLISFKPAFRKKASNMALDMTEKALIEKDQAKQILIQIIVYGDELTTMERAWKELKKLDPSSLEQSEIIRSPKVDSLFPDFAKRVRTSLVKTVKQEKRDNKQTKAIQRLAQKIDRLKKGQG